VQRPEVERAAGKVDPSWGRSFDCWFEVQGSVQGSTDTAHNFEP
jgi:hypothetical protein